MKDVKLDTSLVAASPYSDKTNNFVNNVMTQVRKQSLAHHVSAKKPRFTFAKRHKIAWGIAVFLLLSIVSFSGYAYAIGSDPISLITRIVQGNTVKVQYNGRKFEYGKARTYSDAAITAYAELNTVRSLDSRAASSFGAPKDGIEYFDDVLHPHNYMYPTVGTVTSADDTSVTLTQLYLLGDKMNPSRDISESLAANADNVYFYKNGEPAKLTAADLHSPVAIFGHKLIRHDIATNLVKQVTVYFVFALTHPLADIKEANAGTSSQNQQDTPLFEPNWGGMSNMCYNNPSDTCDNDKIGHDQGEGMFVSAQSKAYTGGHEGGNMYNADTMPFGESAPNGSPLGIMQRNVQGAIIAMDDTTITIRTSSGAEWHIAYTTAERHAFDNLHARKPLRIGDQLAIGVLQSVYDLNNRVIDHTHVMFALRLT